MTTVNPVLAQKIGLKPAGADAPEAEGAQASPMRQMRRAMARAADQAVGLSARVLGIADDKVDAEALIENAPDGWIVLGLRAADQAGLSGLMLLDPNLRSALVEMQTMGCLLPKSEDPRPVTRTDGLMSVPFAGELLSELAAVGFAAGEVEVSGYDIGPMDDLRTAGLVLGQGSYRTWRVTLQLGGSDAQGEAILALQTDPETADATDDDDATWSATLKDAVCQATAELEAVLTTQKMTIRYIERFEVGQVIPLPGAAVDTVQLRGPGGKSVAQARLGQVVGKRAVRLETSELHLQDTMPPPAAQVPDPQTLNDSAPAVEA